MTTQTSCPIGVTAPQHLRAQEACRCGELEEILAEAGEARHCWIVDLGIKPGHVNAWRRGKVVDTYDLAAATLSDLDKVDGLPLIGFAATIYLAARRGVRTAPLDLSPSSPVRIALQHGWEATGL